MAATDNFRSSLHGFNRTDVVQFIQQQTASHDKAMRSLKDENTRLQEALTESRAELEAVKAENASLVIEVEMVRLELTKAQEALEAKPAPAPVPMPMPVPAPVPVPMQEDPIVVPTAVAPIVPEMSAPTMSDFNELELMAYRRAEMAERLAKERAEASAQRMKAIFAQTDEKLNISAADIAIVIEAFQKDYEKLQNVLAELRGIVDESSSGVKAASDLCDNN